MSDGAVRKIGLVSPSTKSSARGFAELVELMEKSATPRVAKERIRRDRFMVLLEASMTLKFV